MATLALFVCDLLDDGKYVRAAVLAASGDDSVAERNGHHEGDAIIPM
jgi:hypothetical protein